MGRTLAIVSASALVGGVAGAAVGIAVDGGHSRPATRPGAPVVAQPASAVRTGPAHSPEAIYRADSIEGVTAFTGGDAIVAVNGEPVTSPGQLSDRLAPLTPGDRVRLQVVRGSATRTVDVTRGNVPG